MIQLPQENETQILTNAHTHAHSIMYYEDPLHFTFQNFGPGKSKNDNDNSHGVHEFARSLCLAGIFV